MSTIRNGKRFASIPEDLVFDASLSCGAKTLYGILELESNRGEGVTFKSMKQIASILGVGIDTARVYRVELESAGWVKNLGQPRISGMKVENRYDVMEEI